uniref:Uncharacterized protein n=1 Tax=Rhizophora mucronata TaxID=61149 RepID=A0A2P2NM69_RHIMU
MSQHLISVCNSIKGPTTINNTKLNELVITTTFCLLLNSIQEPQNCDREATAYAINNCTTYRQHC